MTENKEIPYSQELIRKTIHLISLSIPLGYTFLSKKVSLIVLVPITMLFVIFDVLSKRHYKVRQFVLFIFGKMMRPHEMHGDYKLNGASWVLISSILCILVFPKVLTITGFSILIISDICAALVGKKIGRIAIFGKTLEGTLAFIVSAIMVVFFIGWQISAPATFFGIGIIASIVGGISELISKRINIDDNLSIPVSIGFVMWGGDLIAFHMYHISYLHLM
jgi:dolichol kinase